LSASILEQLTTPLHDFVIPRPQLSEGSELPASKAMESNNLSTGADPGQDVKVCYLVKVIGLKCNVCVLYYLHSCVCDEKYK
jgi:hypothetical protein